MGMEDSKINKSENGFISKLSNNFESMEIAFISLTQS